MRIISLTLRPLWWLLSCLLLPGVMVACVDPEDLMLRGTVNVIVVDGTVTNLAEPQIFRLNRSKADPLTGRFGTTSITKARVEVVVDSVKVVTCHETVDGSYQLPNDFKGRIGHAYQLRFTLSDGTRYVSNQQVMPTVSAIDKLSVRFNASSLPVGQYLSGFRAGYDVVVDTRDPPGQRNYYRWDWSLYEKQKWCRSCYRGVFIDTVQQGSLQNGVYVYIRKAVEDCMEPMLNRPDGDYYNDYICRTQCWDILHNYNLSLLDDKLTDGGFVSGRLVAQVPLFTRQPALLELRQLSLTAGAYRFYQLFQQQMQNTGGLADTPPTAILGNVTNTANSHEPVVGYFTAAAVATGQQWLDKKDATRLPLGAYDNKGMIVLGKDELFFVENYRQPVQGPEGPPFIAGGAGRYITALCIPGDNRTPVKPVGWPD